MNRRINSRFKEERGVETLEISGYFLDLYEETGLKRRGDYFEIARILFETPFRAVLIFDQNRSLEAFSMREWLFGSVGKDYKGPVNCLEILWSVALKMSDLSVGNDGYLDPREGFWEIFSNLGLDKFEEIRSISEGREASFLINRWLDRGFDRRGNGGLFPLKKPRKDQRKVEIWYQMQEYLEENSGACG